MSKNLLSELASAISTATGSASSTVSSAISSVFASKFSSEESSVTTLGSLGPGNDPNDAERAAMITQLTNQLAGISTTPQAVYALLSVLKGLIGKTDAASLEQWAQITTAINSDLASVSSSIF